MVPLNELPLLIKIVFVLPISGLSALAALYLLASLVR